MILVDGLSGVFSRAVFGIPLWGLTYFAMSLVTLVAYAIDKRRAKLNRRRIPERTLHLLSLAFGFPGAFVGQQLFRHKRRKVRFMVVFWMIVALHIGIATALNQRARSSANPKDSGREQDIAWGPSDDGTRGTLRHGPSTRSQSSLENESLRSSARPKRLSSRYPP